MKLKNISFKDVLRDTSFLFVLSYWSGVLSGFLLDVLSIENGTGLFIFINYSSVFFGFCIVARWCEENTFRHLCAVAVFLLLLSLLEAVIGKQGSYFLFTFVAVAIMVPLSWKISGHNSL